MGQFNPRTIRNTNTPSEHAYGAAIDIGVPNERVGRQVALWLDRNRERFGIQNILYDPLGWHGANIGDHVNHIHVGFLY